MTRAILFHLLGVLPNPCLFMDDSTENTTAAWQMGLSTIHWSSRQTGFHRFSLYPKIGEKFVF
jgi:FMN phosphatase YigB (HAD superfamily)